MSGNLKYDNNSDYKFCNETMCDESCKLVTDNGCEWNWSDVKACPEGYVNRKGISENRDMTGSDYENIPM
tara:strand:- start:422 stop:631 length:210 start_codon:yes stop_codon:yes gene_type:complete